MYEFEDHINGCVFSTFWGLSQTVDLASMEPNRAWHDPVVEIYSNLITPGVRCSAEAYDLANRRWYCLKVEAEIEHDQWLSSTIATHLGQYYAANREEPPWNTIRMNAEGSLNPTGRQSRQTHSKVTVLWAQTHRQLANHGR